MVQRLLRIWRSQQQSVALSTGSFWVWGLCNKVHSRAPGYQFITGSHASQGSIPMGWMSHIKSEHFSFILESGTSPQIPLIYMVLCLKMSSALSNQLLPQRKFCLRAAVVLLAVSPPCALRLGKHILWQTWSRCTCIWQVSWWAAVYAVPQTRTRLKQLSSSSSSSCMLVNWEEIEPSDFSNSDESALQLRNQTPKNHCRWEDRSRTRSVEQRGNHTWGSIWDAWGIKDSRKP